MKQNQGISLKDRDDLQKEDIRKLVLARIKASSNDLVISIGSTEYTKKQILESVETGDEVGMEVMDIQMEYLRDMAQGAIYNE